MARYLVIHTPKPEAEREVRRPTRLVDIARASSVEGVRPRWIRTWTPDLNDERIFSLWEAANAAEIIEALENFGFLDDMTAQALNVREWGPADVLAAEDDRLEQSG
jgi:hypothetical protein